MSIELRCGKWQEVLADVECDALITDPPYSARTHKGHDDGSASANRVGLESDRRLLGYTAWTPSDVDAFVGSWSPRVRGWFVAMTDHVLAPAWERAFEAAGRYVFAPLQFMQVGSRVRISGDGPSLWTITIVVARPKTKSFLQWGALPGGYVLPPGCLDRSPVVGGKPLWLMRQIVLDYSRPGDLICDPCAGGATTLLAARLEGRRAIGAECDAATYSKALARLAVNPVETGKQTVLF